VVVSVIVLLMGVVSKFGVLKGCGRCESWPIV
jgi:hypothetical protein